MKRWINVMLLVILVIVGALTPNGNAFAASTTGWKSLSGHWYYYTSKGKATGWFYNGSKWYFFDSTGVMKTGWILSGGKWYCLNTDGSMATGWKNASGKWYFLNPDGSMATGWKDVSGKWYFLSTGGAMQTGWLKQGNITYYLLPYGDMATGWQTISGKQYYFASSGAMAVNTTVNGKEVGADGAVVVTQHVSPVTPLEKALNDANAYGATVQDQTDSTYNVYYKNAYIGSFNTLNDEAECDNNQYVSLFESIAIDLGFNANAQELESLVNQVQSNQTFNMDVLYDGTKTTFYWGSTVFGQTVSVSNAVKDVSAAGAVAKPGNEGTYNIFKNNAYIGFFNPQKGNEVVEGNGQYAKLLETVAIDLGYNGTADQLDSLVQQVIAGSTFNNNVLYDGNTLSINF